MVRAYSSGAGLFSFQLLRSSRVFFGRGDRVEHALTIGCRCLGTPWAGEWRLRLSAKLDAGTLLEIHLRELKLDFRREWAFFPGRKWRFDYALGDFAVNGRDWIPGKTAIEIEGGIWNNGAHVRGKHFLSDAEKYNTAAALGWKVFRFTPEQILKGEAKAFIERYL